MESDFQRDYHIDLVHALRDLTWRRFATLLRGLGPNSASASRAYLRKYARTTDDPEEAMPITDHEQARRAFLAEYAHQAKQPEVVE